MTETWTGRAACLLLALVWFVSMGVADANAYSYVPLLAGLIVVILLALSAMIRGAKVVQLSKTAWISLGVGVYFLVRCLCSFSVVESWQEASLILGCGVFYVAGLYAAQGHTFRTVLRLLVIAGVLNLVYYWLMHYTDAPMEWAGRPAVGPGSINHRPMTLFVYKNHAAAFLCMVGMLLFAAALWVKTKGVYRLGLGALALLCVLISAECNSRSPYFMVPVMLLCGWVLWVVTKLYEDDKLGLGTMLSGFVILGTLGVGICSALFETDFVRFFEGLDSHGRFAIWRETCRLLPGTPPWGNGALSVQWLIMAQPGTHFDFCAMANMAHNEYLQAWTDYGFIGLGGVLFIIGWHCCRGLMIIASEAVPSRQRLLTALALLCFIAWSACSIVDFFWHHFAIAGMTAFCAGMTASPYAYMNKRKGIHRRVAAQSAHAKGGLAFIGMLSVGCSCWLVSNSLQAWELQWEFNRLSRPGEDETGEQRHELLARLVPNYPGTELMDQYFRIPRHRDNWRREANLMYMTLAANPRQQNTAAMLAEFLSRHGQHEEAESVYRRYYSGDGPDRTLHGDWANMYALNLLRRGQAQWSSGNQAMAYSLLQYGLKIVQAQPGGWSADFPYRADERVWLRKGRYMPKWYPYLKAREQDVTVLRMLNVVPDDSWQAPDASGKPSLYRRYGATENLEKADSAATAPATAKKE